MTDRQTDRQTDIQDLRIYATSRRIKIVKIFQVRIGHFPLRKTQAKNTRNSLKCVLRRIFFPIFRGVGGIFTRTEFLSFKTLSRDLSNYSMNIIIEDKNDQLKNLHTISLFRKTSAEHGKQRRGGSQQLIADVFAINLIGEGEITFD